MLSGANGWWVPSTEGTVPPSRYAHTTAYYKGKIYIFGGFNGITCFNDIYTLDLGACCLVTVAKRDRSGAEVAAIGTAPSAAGSGPGESARVRAVC